MAIVGVTEAASQLGLTPRRVRQMISAGMLPARRVGRSWAIDERDLRLAGARRRPPNRPWKPASAWAVLAAADGFEPPSLTPYERHRVRKRLAVGLPNLIAHLSERARRRTFYAHPSTVDLVAAMPGVVRTAASAVDEHQIDLVGPGPAEAYVSQAVFEQIAANHPLEERTERPNLVLRVVADGDWPFPEGTVVAPRAVTAVDLLESDDERARRAGVQLLDAL